MLIHPVAIAAALFYFIIAQLSVSISESFQVKHKRLCEHARQQLYLARFRHRASRLGPQDYPVVFNVATVEALRAASVGASATHPVEVAQSFPTPGKDNVGAVIPEVTPTNHNDPSSSTPVLPFVVPQYSGPFRCHEVLSRRVQTTLALIFLSTCLSLVAGPFISKLLPRSGPLGKTESPDGELHKQLPPICLPPPKIWTQKHAPLEPIFTPAPTKIPSFWLASEKQDQSSHPSPPLLHLLGLPSLENDLQKKLSPLSSPADSGYGTTLSDTASDNSAATTPDHPGHTLPATGTPSTLVHDSKNVIASFENCTGDDVDFTEYDNELHDDDDDGSTTVTNSNAYLTNLVSRPPSPPVEELASRLKSVAIVSFKEVESVSEPVEVLSISLTLGTTDKGPVAEEAPFDPSLPSEPCLDVAGVEVDSTCIDNEVTAGNGFETITEEDETAVEGDFPVGGDSEDESWSPDYEVPIISISPPSDDETDEFALQLDPEDESEESEDAASADELDHQGEDEGSECDYDCELEHTGGYPRKLAVEVVSDSPSSPTDAYHSPITKTGVLWSDLESGDPGPLPVFGIPHEEVFDALETEIPDATGSAERIGPPADDGAFDVTRTASEEATIEESVIEAASEPLGETVQETPIQDTAEPTPTIPDPSRNPPHAPNSSLTHRRALGTPSQRIKYFHCCDRPESWITWELGADCIPRKTNIKETQFIRPRDEDGGNPTTRIVIDNLDARWFLKTDGGHSYRLLTEPMRLFVTKSYQCWASRVIDGVEHASVGYATVDFDSVDDAIRLFEAFQGRRLRGQLWHWRLEFLDPTDETHGGRKVIRTELVPDSVKKALAAELEASTRRRGRYSSTCRLDNADAEAPAIPSPPVRVRPQVDVPRRSLFAGAIANAVGDRRANAQPSARTPQRP